MAVAIPTFLQTKSYTAAATRALFLDTPIQNGVTAAGDLMVTQRGAGATMSVDVAAGNAWIKGTTSARQGFYDLYNDATVNVGIANNAGAAGTYRIDQIILRIYDSVDGGAAQDIGAIEVVQGASSNAFGSATLALNARTGVGALPASSIVLADVAVVGGAGSILNTAIRDRRPWCRGAFYQTIRTTNGVGGSNYTTSTGSPGAAIDTTTLNPRIECSGAPVTVTLTNHSVIHSVANGRVDFHIRVDGTQLDGGAMPYRTVGHPTAGNGAMGLALTYTFVPTAGSHLIAPYWSVVDAGTATLQVSTAGSELTYTVREDLRQNTANNSVTSG